MSADPSIEAIVRLLAARVPDMARAAVPVPTIRFGTVDETPDTSSTYVSVLVDGMDEQATAVLNGTGEVLGAGQRVVVLFYPPHGAIVAGRMVPRVETEQIWHGQITVPTSGTVSEVMGSGWSLLTARGIGWEANGGNLECVVPGLWEASLHAQWASNGDGTHRAASVLVNGARLVSSSQQFTGPGGTPTVGYGLAGAGGPVPFSAVVDDLVTIDGRQNSGVSLTVDVYLKLRLAGPA